MKHLEEVLKKMFSYVGEKYTPEYVKQPNWYWTHSWTPKQENDFIDWLANFLTINTEARKEFTSSGLKGSGLMKKLAEEFVCNYGWKTIDMNDCSDLDTNDL